MVPRLVPEILSLDAFCDTAAVVVVGIGDSGSWIHRVYCVMYRGGAAAESEMESISIWQTSLASCVSVASMHLHPLELIRELCKAQMFCRVLTWWDWLHLVEVHQF